MATDFQLPDLGEGIAEAEIIEWLVKEGDLVAEHQPLVQVETDKAVVEVPSPVSGRIGRLRHRTGDIVHVGEILVTILATGESEAAAAPPRRSSTTVVGSLEDKEVELPPQQPGPARAMAAHEVLATPAVRRLARELGVAIEEAHGTGIAGRITEADVRELAAARPEPTAPREEPETFGAVERIALRGIRRTIARRLKTAVTQAALTTHMDEIDVTRLVARIRGEHEGSGSISGAFPWIVKGTVEALKIHPRFNATLDDEHEEVHLKRYFNIGIAIDTSDGLMVPVIHSADRLSVEALATEIDRLASACRKRSVEIKELRGGTFSISNIGSLGGIFATPIPNYPELAILATGRIAERLAREADGSIVSRHFLPVSLSFDHRVLDGADAARFVNALKEILAEPEKLSGG